MVGCIALVIEVTIFKRGRDGGVLSIIAISVRECIDLAEDRQNGSGTSLQLLVREESWNERPDLVLVGLDQKADDITLVGFIELLLNSGLLAKQ